MQLRPYQARLCSCMVVTGCMLQVHGHDFACAAVLPTDPAHPGRHTYLSGSEEKVLRVMEAPQAFLDTLAAATGQPAPPADVQVMCTASRPVNLHMYCGGSASHLLQRACSSVCMHPVCGARVAQGHPGSCHWAAGR